MNKMKNEKIKSFKQTEIKILVGDPLFCQFPERFIKASGYE